MGPREQGVFGCYEGGLGIISGFRLYQDLPGPPEQLLHVCSQRAAQPDNARNSARPTSADQALFIYGISSFYSGSNNKVLQGPPKYLPHQCSHGWQERQKKEKEKGKGSKSYQTEWNWQSKVKGGKQDSKGFRRLQSRLCVCSRQCLRRE